jgi:hypothetical protein
VGTGFKVLHRSCNVDACFGGIPMVRMATKRHVQQHGEGCQAGD